LDCTEYFDYSCSLCSSQRARDSSKRPSTSSTTAPDSLTTKQRVRSPPLDREASALMVPAPKSSLHSLLTAGSWCEDRLASISTRLLRPARGRPRAP